MYMKKKRGRQYRRNFESVHALFVICTCFTSLHPSYMRIHSFLPIRIAQLFMYIIRHGIKRIM